MPEGDSSPEQEIQTCIDRKDFPALLGFCQDFELDMKHVAFPQEVSICVYKVHVLTTLIEGNLNLARFLWKRIPAALKTADSELPQIWKAGQHMWEKEHIKFYSSLRQNWTVLVRRLVNTLKEVYQQNMVSLISKAYSSLQLLEASQLLDMSEDEALTLFTDTHGLHWKYNESSKILTPQSPQDEQAQCSDALELQQLNDYVIYLEQQQQVM